MHSKYKRMLKVMQEKEIILKQKKAKRGKQTKAEKSWLLYMLRCSDGTFYTGITNDLTRRLKMHSSGRASHYTRTRRPIELLYQEPCGTRTSAMVRECAVKALPRKSKEALVGSSVR